MKVAVWATQRVVACQHALLIVLLWLFTGSAIAQAQTGPAEQRAKAVTQVVLGILSYARWPVEPAQLRLCIIGPTEYTDDLVKGTTQATGHRQRMRCGVHRQAHRR